MRESKCEKCGTVMMPFKEDKTAGMRCPKCGWNFTATQFDPIDLDETIYTAKFDAITNPSKYQLKIVSKILNANFLVAARLLKEGNASFSGKANEIQNKLKDAKGLDIHYKISPEFKYDI